MSNLTFIHHKNQYQHNVIVQNENGQTIGVITDKYDFENDFSVKKDWRVFNSIDEQLNLGKNKHFKQDTPNLGLKSDYNEKIDLNILIDKIKNMGEDIFNPKKKYVVEINSSYGLQYYLSTDKDGVYPYSLTLVFTNAKLFSYEDAKRICSSGLTDLIKSLRTNYHDEVLEDAFFMHNICK